MANLSRRNLLRGRWRSKRSAVRPPWIISETVFINGCTRCKACVENCETRVIFPGTGGFPELDFSRSECSFCGKCAEACPEPIFQESRGIPWRYSAEIDTQCLTNRGVECRACGDSCDAGAIKFRLKLGGVAQPALDNTQCSGCGACVRYCPVNAITVKDPTLNDEYLNNE